MFVVTPGPGPISGPNLPLRNAPQGTINRISGFMVDVSGTVTFEPAECSGTVAIPVQPGVQYHIACKRIVTWSGTTIWGAL